MNTSHAASFFQSQDAQDKAARQAAKSGNKLGAPTVFPTKLLSITTDQTDATWLYLTESGSVARRVSIETGETQVYRGHTAPVTCSVVASHLYITGSWDKTIRVFDKASRQCLHVLVGHADFIKCLLYNPTLGLLLSGSSDRTIRVWCLKDFKCLYTLKAHPRAVEQLCLLHSGQVLSAGSEGSLCTWDITRESGKQVGEPFWGHETGINKLLEDNDSLYTASNDRFARQFAMVDALYKEEAKLPHPDYVRDVLLYGPYIITACRDEQIRLFEGGSGKLKFTLEGHFSEITGLAIVGQTLFSVSIDCTLRRWGLTAAGLGVHIAEQAAWTPEPEVAAKEQVMSAEELAELEEFMSDD